MNDAFTLRRTLSEQLAERFPCHSTLRCEQCPPLRMVRPVLRKLLSTHVLQSTPGRRFASGRQRQRQRILRKESRVARHMQPLKSQSGQTREVQRCSTQVDIGTCTYI